MLFCQNYHEHAEKFVTSKCVSKQCRPQEIDPCIAPALSVPSLGNISVPPYRLDATTGTPHYQMKPKCMADNFLRYGLYLTSTMQLERSSCQLELCIGSTNTRFVSRVSYRKMPVYKYNGLTQTLK